MSPLFNTLSRFVIGFFPKEQTYFNFMVAVTICSDFGVQENEVCYCFHCFPIYLPKSGGISDAMILDSGMLSFKPVFTFEKDPCISEPTQFKPMWFVQGSTVL